MTDPTASRGMPEPSATPLSYAYQPRLGGAGIRMDLDGDALSWMSGPREGRLALRDVTGVQLRFQPAKFAHSSFEMELRGKDGTRLKAASASRVSLTGVRDQGAEYKLFAHALHHALARAGARPECRGGYPAWRWWLMAALGALAGAGLVAVFAFAVLDRQWGFALFLGVLSVFVVWPTVETIWRNRPVRYALADPPAHLLPA